MAKPKNSFWISFAWGVGIIVISTMIAIWITGYTYLYKTLIYTYPDIDDLSIFDARVVNDSAVQQWPAGIDYNKKKLPKEFSNELENYQTVEFVVIKNDSLVYEQYWDRYNEKSLSNSFSVAKSIVALLTGIAADEGLIHLDDPVGKYISEFSEGDNAKLTIRHLLMMASGLNWDESYNSIFSMTTEAYYGENLEQLVKKLKVVEEPGKIYRYQSCNTVLLAMVIAKVTGKTISDYAADKLWKPLGATQPAMWSLDHQNGLEKSYCCFYSNARDFAKIGQLILDSGKWNGRKIISPEFISLCTSPNNCKDDKGKNVDYYGYQWWLAEVENHKVIYARGINGQYIIVIPDKRMVIVRLGKKRGEKLDNQHYSDMWNYTKYSLNTF